MKQDPSRGGGSTLSPAYSAALEQLAKRRSEQNKEPGLLEKVARIVLPIQAIEDEIKKIDEEDRFVQSYKDYNSSRSLSGPIKYYDDLDRMKQSVLSDMAYGIQRSADAEEGIRKQRMLAAPNVFPTERATALTYGAPGSFTGQYETPKFVVGNVSQNRLDDSVRSTSTKEPNALMTNYMAPQVARLKPGQVLLVTDNDKNRFAITKGDDGIATQVQLGSDEYKNYVEALRTGLPIGYNQTLIDQWASRSLKPRVKLDEVFDFLPEEQRRLGQFNALYPDLMNDAMGKVISRPNDPIPLANMSLNTWEVSPFYYPEQMGKMEYVAAHELGHVFDQAGTNKGLSATGFFPTGFGPGFYGTEEYDAVREADAKSSAKYKNNFNTPLDVEDFVGEIVVGKNRITPYGVTNVSEDFAERFALYRFDQINGFIGYDNEGNAIRFSEVFPNTAKYIENAMNSSRR